jgi:hypothetical protein
VFCQIATPARDRDKPYFVVFSEFPYTFYNATVMLFCDQLTATRTLPTIAASLNYPVTTTLSLEGEKWRVIDAPR